MIEYIYIVKCPGREDEIFNFFTEARMQCDLLMSKKPSITQVEVERNDFGECTDSHDLGTVWSWEEAMKDTEDGYTEAEPAKTLFTKDDLKLMANGQDPEFDNLDNSVDCEVEEPKLTEASPADATRAPKDSDYVIVLKNPITNRHTFFGNNYRMTTNLNKAMTYPGKFSAQDDIKYAADQSVQATNDPNDFYYEDNFFVVTVAEAKKLQGKYEDKLQHKARLDERKPIPEGMTIEQIVEEMEENEDTVECTWCNDLFDKSECRKEVDLGWLCSRCEAAIKSRGETLTFRENNYWDFLDESTAVQDSTMIGKYVQLVYHNSKYQEAGSPLTDFGLKRLLKTNKNCKLSSRDIDFIAKFDNRCKVIQETEDGYLVKIPYYYRDRQEHSKFEERPRYVECWVPKTNTKIINEGLSKEISAECSLEELVKDSINHLINDLGKDSSAEDFADDVIADIENNYDIEVPENPEKYRDWASAVACEVSRQLNNRLGEELEVDELHDLGNEYDGGYPDETPEVSDSHLKLCPECGKETFDIETGICVECGFN